MMMLLLPSRAQRLIDYYCPKVEVLPTDGRSFIFVAPDGPSPRFSQTNKESSHHHHHLVRAYYIDFTMTRLLHHLLFPCLFAFLLMAAPVAAQEEEVEADSILVLGDSWAALSKDFLSAVCGLTNPFSFEAKDTVNTAQSGSTAAEWAASENAREAFQKSDYDYVWLSLGGNDFLDSACDLDLMEQVSADIIQVISQIIESTSNPHLMILYLGYAIPSEDVCGGGTTATLFETVAKFIAKSIESSAYADRVKVIDISDKLVTSASKPLSDSQWFADSIHMHEDGYIKIFGMPSVQRFFGCYSDLSSTVGDLISKRTESMGISNALLIPLVVLAVILVIFVSYCMCCRKSKKERNVEKEAEQGCVVMEAKTEEQGAMPKDIKEDDKP